MNVIMLEEVMNLGQRGEIKKVADGYARNYLIPNGMAIIANASNTANIENLRRNWKKKENRERAAANEQKRAIMNKSPLTITMKAGPEGKLYGSVTNQDIATMLSKDCEFDVDKRRIQLDAHIKTIGEHKVNIHLYSEVDAEVLVRVTDENGNIAPVVAEEAPKAEKAPEQAAEQAAE